jgi:chemotaxis protein methyltransferase CheR
MTAAQDPSPREVERFRTLVSHRLGLLFGDGRLSFLAEVLSRRTSSAGRPPSQYLACLESADPASDEVQHLAEELTITETYFFRAAEQLRAFADLVRLDPPASAAAGSAAPRRRLRVLSAACASGEEAYSLAMVLRDLPAAANWEITIRAIDVNPTMLARAARGHYSAWALRETPPEVQARHFHPAGREVVLDAAVRSMVAFEQRNLAADDPAFWQPDRFDVVFCRNVIMYFTPETQRAVVARIARSLAPGGLLFLGSAETLRGLSLGFHLRHTHDTFYYERRDESGSGYGQPSPASPGARRPPDPVPPDTASSGQALADGAWVENIRRASERIRALAAPAAAAPEPVDTDQGSGRAQSAWDLGGAVELMRQERFSEALALLGALPAPAGNDADVLLLKAVLLTHGGDLAAAEKLCAQVIERDQMSAGAHYLTALCRADAGDHRAAVDHDQIAAYLDPGFAMPRLHLGLLARRTGAAGAARRDLGDALVLLGREDASRLLLFGGGFDRHALMALCRAELVSCGGAP